ncbi:MAG TPA: type III pantothenate kinase [Leucothrix sp.]|nr:type III pantothenate kinase [Leucothrix sp.]
MTALLIDAGNSSIKWCLLKDNNLGVMQRCNYQALQNDKQKTPQQCIESIINSNQASAKSVFMVSVVGDNFITNAQSYCADLKLNFINITSSTELAGVRNAYDEPQKLGADRLVAMVAAQHQNKNPNDKQANIIIDSGTATTIDAVDESGQHLGGLILPGFKLCTQSLLSNTKQLPLWGQSSGETMDDNQLNFIPEIFSKNTRLAIQSASVLGLAGAIDSICSNMAKHFDKNISVNKILCGGSAKILQPYLQSTVTLNESLIMQGLKVIAEHTEPH